MLFSDGQGLYLIVWTYECHRNMFTTLLNVIEHLSLNIVHIFRLVPMESLDSHTPY